MTQMWSFKFKYIKFMILHTHRYIHINIYIRHRMDRDLNINYCYNDQLLSIVSLFHCSFINIIKTIEFCDNNQTLL